MQQVSSIIDERAVDPHAAQAALDRLAGRRREGLVGALCVAIAGAVLAVAGQLAIALPAAAGAVVGLLVALSAHGDRRQLVVRLVGQRSAYSIPEVAEAARRMATRERRNELARSLTRIVMAATGFEPASPTLAPLHARVEAHADEILAIAYLLARDGVKVHPASLALLDRLITSAPRSPLFNPAVPEQHLRIALQRIRSAIDA
jgi:hypothetical protein